MRIDGHAISLRDSKRVNELLDKIFDEGRSATNQEDFVQSVFAPSPTLTSSVDVLTPVRLKFLRADR
jgi:hypothetical protein